MPNVFTSQFTAQQIENALNGVIPSGTKDITGTGLVDVKSFAYAQVVDEDLAAENVRSGKNILGVQGECPYLQSKNLVLGASAPPALIEPDNDKDGLSGVNVSIDTSVFKSEDIRAGKSLLGVAGGFIDPLPYITSNIRFGHRYPSLNPDIYCPLVSDWFMTFGETNGSYLYETIKIKSDVAITAINGAFQNNPNLTSITIDCDLSACGNYDYVFGGLRKLEEVRGTPLDFSNVLSWTRSSLGTNVGENTANGVWVRYKANSLHVGQNVNTVKFTDDSLVSVANGMQSGTYKDIQLSNAMKAKLLTIMGTIASVTESGVTYDLFTADASGSTSLQSFITQTKGWTIA